MKPINSRLHVGRIGKPHGVRGWFRVISFTDPAEGIFNYTPWHIKASFKGADWRCCQHIQHKVLPNCFVAKIEGCDDMEAAKALTHAAIAIDESQLAPLEKGEYYWTDLENLNVITTKKEVLGVIDHLFPTGSNDVLVVKDPKGLVYLVPYTDDAVKNIDLKNKQVTVDSDYIISEMPKKP